MFKKNTDPRQWNIFVSPRATMDMSGDSRTEPAQRDIAESTQIMCHFFPWPIEVLRFCKAELVADNYFHAVLEVVKSVADKLRTKTGLTEDGGTLLDRALSGDIPMLGINPLQTTSHRSEQKGFANLVRGTFGMFRNPVAHEARIHWPMSKDDAEDLLSLVSLIHRRLDASHMPPRI